MTRFNHLNVPSHWEKYWTRYPEGYTILEALINWVSQVDSMVDNINDLNAQMDEFIATFDKSLQSTVRDILEEWNADGTLSTIIQDAVVKTKADIRDRGVNIYDFYTNDWTAAIKEAITSLGAAGGVVIIPNGTYDVGHFEIPSNVKLLGIGNVVLRALPLETVFVREILDGTTTDIYPLVYSNASSNAKLENITVDANKAVQTKTTVAGILFTGCHYPEFKDVLVKGNKSPGSVQGGAWNLFRCDFGNIFNSGVDDIAVEGLLLRDSHYMNVHKGEFKNSTSTALGTQNGSRIFIDGVHAHDCENSCISLNSTDSKIVNSLAHDSRAFVPINLGHRTTYATRKPADRSIVANNHVYNGYKGGIYVGYGKDIQIHDNEVWDCRGAYDAADTANVAGGISPSGWVDHITVTDNKVWNCGRGVYAVFGRSDADETLGSRIQIKDNVILNSAWQAIDVYDPKYGVVIEGNTCYGSNIEDNTTRAEIRITCSGDLGQVRIKGNMLGYPGVAKGDAIRVTWVSDNLGYAVNIQDNEFIGFTRTVLASANNMARLVYKNNIVNNVFVA